MHLRRKNQQRRGLKPQIKKRSGWRFRPGKTSKKKKKKPSRKPENLVVRTQKRCLLNRQREAGQEAFKEEARALKLLKGAHIKIGWVSCRVRRKKKVNRCFRGLGFGHIAVDCRGPDRSRCCWRCGEEGHVAGSWSGKPRCYVCAAREEKPRNDYIPGGYALRGFSGGSP